MNKRIQKVAVLGSGVMGSALAAHFANAGLQALVLDIVPKEAQDSDDPRARNKIASDSVRAMSRSQPAPLFAASRLELIEIGNLEDDLSRLADADWIIEAVKEDLSIKKVVLETVAPHIGEHAILSSNTSGLSLAAMAEALPQELRGRFLGTHFFNPPRYMKLLEVIPTADTAPEVVERISTFATDRLGKGVVPAKDTPDFIANRIGVHSMMHALRFVDSVGTIEEVDALSGPALARPKTATFRLADLVGLDTLLLVARTVLEHAPDDEDREVFAASESLGKMVDKGLLGRKTGAGFYRRVNKPEKKILTFDLNTLEYREPAKPNFPELKSLEGLDDPAERVRGLIGNEGKAAAMAWMLLAPTLSYSAMRLGEIADDAATIDRAIRLGFNWELGPFEVWDALGFRTTTERLKADGYALPAWVDALYDAGAQSLYDDEASPTAQKGQRAPVPVDPRAIRFDVLRKRERQVRTNDAASLFDLGDGVLGLEFHTKMNAIDEGTVEMIFAAAEEAENNWQALVVANDGVNFCAGANLMMLVGSAMKSDWKAIERIIASFQQSLDRLEQCAVPTVIAPHGMALGGGAEVVLAGNAVRASAELYCGLVEVGAGLLPAGGGCLRLYRRNLDRFTDRKDLFPALKSTFESIGMARVSSSAEGARELGFLAPGDGWSMNADHRVAAARELALGLARSGWLPPLPERALPVMGRSGVAIIESMLVNMREGRFISDHDQKIGREVARVLSGGDVAGPTTVSAAHMLDLEREAFLRLCGEPKTHERIESLLKTGKPLRN